IRILTRSRFGSRLEQLPVAADAVVDESVLQALRLPLTITQLRVGNVVVEPDRVEHPHGLIVDDGGLSSGCRRRTRSVALRGHRPGSVRRGYEATSGRFDAGAR